MGEGMMRGVQASAVTTMIVLIVTVFVSDAFAARCFFYSDDVGTVGDGRSEPEPNQFEVPEEFDESLLRRVTYARMNDNTNVYPEPNIDSTPLYNRGEGFLYVTVQEELAINGSNWYELNPGQYVLVEDVRIVEASDFHGVEIATQPERPFGWFVQDVVPSDAPGGEPNNAYQKKYRFEFFQIYDASVDDDGWIWYDLGHDRWVRQTYLSVVDVDSPQEDVGPGDYWVEVDLYEQTFAAYEGELMVYAGLVSSGLNKWPTHEGLFQVFSSYRQVRMSGAEGKIDYYFIEDVPYTMYFDRRNEIALHGAYWHDRYGYKHSHGCVNMPPRDAEWVYFWSSGAKNDLWVWVHTSDPMSYFSRYGDQPSQSPDSLQP